MGQHLYECERCRKIGVAHYLLTSDMFGYFLILVCTACFRLARKKVAA